MAKIKAQSRTSRTDISVNHVKIPSASHEEIEQLAYSNWFSHGQQSGTAEHDWLRAEQTLRGGA